MYKRTTLAPNVFRLHVVSELRKKKDQTPQTKTSGPRDFFKGLLGTVGTFEDKRHNNTLARLQKTKDLFIERQWNEGVLNITSVLEQIWVVSQN